VDENSEVQAVFGRQAQAEFCLGDLHNGAPVIGLGAFGGVWVPLEPSRPPPACTDENLPTNLQLFSSCNSTAARRYLQQERIFVAKGS
jgi:hypothetical protein